MPVLLTDVLKEGSLIEELDLSLSQHYVAEVKTIKLIV